MVIRHIRNIQRGLPHHLLKYIMLLFVKVEDKRMEVFCVFPKDLCFEWNRYFLLPTTWVDFSQQKQIYSSLPGQKTRIYSELELKETGWKTWTSLCLHKEAWRTFYCIEHEWVPQRCVADGSEHSYQGPITVLSAMVPALPSTIFEQIKAERKIIASRWLLCYK